MIARKNAQGLYVFDVEVMGRNYTKIVKGCVDTGSTDCASTYKCIVPLNLKPINYTMIETVGGGSSRRKSLVYDIRIKFDQQSIRVPLVRIPNTPEGIDFILGLTVLNHCTITLDSNEMQIEWNYTI